MTNAITPTADLAARLLNVYSTHDLRAKIASHEYSAELLLQHAMANIEALEMRLQALQRGAAAPAEAIGWIGAVRVDSGEVHIVPRERDAELSPLADGQRVYAAPVQPAGDVGTKPVAWHVHFPDCDGSADWAELGTNAPDLRGWAGAVAKPLVYAGDVGAVPAGWRPIETAPKDGTSFLGWVAAVRYSSEDGGGSGREHDESTVDFCWYVPERPDETGGYFTNASGQIGDAQDITHWVALPAAPKE